MKRWTKCLEPLIAIAASIAAFSAHAAWPADGGAKEGADFANAETAKWAGAIKSSNIKLD